MNVTEALRLDDKAPITELTGTVAGIFEPEEARGGPFKGKQVQNMYLSEGADKIKVVLSVPSLFQDRGINGSTITLKSTPAIGGPSDGKMFGVTKSVNDWKGKVYEEVRCTAKCVISLDGPSAPSYNGGTQSRPSVNTSPRSQIPFKLYVLDYVEQLKAARDSLSADDMELIKEMGMPAGITVGGSPYMSWLNQNRLVFIDPVEAMAEAWDEYIHPDTGLALKAMHGKNPEKFIDTVVLPSVSGTSNTIPIKVVKKACKGLDIGATEIAERWCGLHSISEAAFAAYIAHHSEGAPKPKDYLAAIKPDLIPAIRAFDTATPERKEEEQSEDW